MEGREHISDGGWCANFQTILQAIAQLCSLTWMIVASCCSRLCLFFMLAFSPLNKSRLILLVPLELLDFTLLGFFNEADF